MSELRELLDSEFNDYGIEWEIEAIERDEDYYLCYVKVSFTYQSSCRHICFKVTNGEVEIELGEDVYEKCESWNDSVKYLWIATLDWPKE